MINEYKCNKIKMWVSWVPFKPTHNWIIVNSTDSIFAIYNFYISESIVTPVSAPLILYNPILDIIYNSIPYNENGMIISKFRNVRRAC